MHLKQIFLIISLLSLFASVGLAKKIDFLKIPDYKNIDLVVELINPNHLGITKDKVTTTSKLRLIRNGLKIDPNNLNYIYICVIALDVVVGSEKLGCAVDLEIFFQKVENGIHKTTTYSSIRSLGLDVKYEDFQETLEDCLDKFILNYLESNME